MSSRRYLRRVWRVPKCRGAPTYLAALINKTLRKHGWPSTVEVVPDNWGDGVQILHHEQGLHAAQDFWAAAKAAVRVVQRTHKIEIETTDRGLVMFLKEYCVTSAGKFKEVDLIYQGKARYPVREVVLHCAAINTDQFKDMPPLAVFSEINRWHIERGFKNGFGYHGLIMPSGIYYRGRPFNMIGAHVQNHNRGTLGFLLIESRKITKVGLFEDWFTVAQEVALKAILEDLRISHGIQTVTGHNDYAPRLCPGFNVKKWLDG